MAIVRIMVDGYSLLHQWPELAPGRARHSAAARQELIHQMVLYRDAIHIPITIVFDGAGGSPSVENNPGSDNIEILFSKSGQTADQIIERVAARMKSFGEVLAVTDDHAERDMVISLGGAASSCSNFIATVSSTMEGLGSEIQKFNQREISRYKKQIS